MMGAFAACRAEGQVRKIVMASENDTKAGRPHGKDYWPDRVGLLLAVACVLFFIVAWAVGHRPAWWLLFCFSGWGLLHLSGVAFSNRARARLICLVAGSCCIVVMAWLVFRE